MFGINKLKSWGVKTNPISQMKPKTNMGFYAQQELNILAKTVPDAIVTPFSKEIIALAEKFGSSGQSGGSAPYTASAICSAIKSLLSFNPICDITGIYDEWNDVSDISNEPMFQNKRCSAVFKHGKDSQAYYIDAIVKKTQNGICYSGHFYLNREDAINENKSKRITCRGGIKKFPFKPKTFYIDVLEEEIAKDDWVMWVKNPKQLDRVWKYYDKV